MTSRTQHDWLAGFRRLALFGVAVFLLLNIMSIVLNAVMYEHISLMDVLLMRRGFQSNMLLVNVMEVLVILLCLRLAILAGRRSCRQDVLFWVVAASAYPTEHALAYFGFNWTLILTLTVWGYLSVLFLLHRMTLRHYSSSDKGFE